MRLHEFETKLNEAMPMGRLSSLGQKLRAKLPGLGAEMAKGKLEVGNLANEIIKAYYKYLGTQPKANQQPTAQNLVKFLKQNQYPVQNAIQTLKSPVAEAGPRTAAQQASMRAAATGVNPPNNPFGLGPGGAAPAAPAPAPATAAPAAPAAPGTPAPMGARQGPLNSKQINAALMAAASEIINKGLAPQAGTPQAATPQATATTSTGPGLGRAFMAGLSGNTMPTSSGTQIPSLDFSDKNSTKYVLQQLQKFAQSGGKLDPNQKALLQKIIAAI